MQFYNKMATGDATFMVFNPEDFLRWIPRYSVTIGPGQTNVYSPGWPEKDYYTVKVRMPAGGGWAYKVPPKGDNAWVVCNGTNDISTGGSTS